MATTIRLEEDFKARLADAAQRAGMTPHAFILASVAQRVEHSEQEAELHRVAEKRWAKVVRGGKTLSLDEAQAHVDQRSAKPTARKRA